MTWRAGSWAWLVISKVGWAVANHDPVVANLGDQSPFSAGPAGRLAWWS